MSYEAAVEIREAIMHLADRLSPPLVPKQQLLDFAGGTPRVLTGQVNDWLEKNAGWTVVSVAYQCIPSEVAYSKGTVHYALVLVQEDGRG